MDLETIRKKLMRLEDTIILYLFERAQYKHNKAIYTEGGIEIPDFKGSFFEYLFIGTEELHSSAGRYIDAEEHSFLIAPSNPKIPRKSENRGIETKVNLNNKILEIYLKNLSVICEEGGR